MTSGLTNRLTQTLAGRCLKHYGKKQGETKWPPLALLKHVSEHPGSRPKHMCVNSQVPVVIRAIREIRE